MRAGYNLIAGQNLGRLAGLADGVFSICMTLLVLDLRVPALVNGEMSDGALWNGLVALAPRFLAYLMSFLTLGIFWLGHQTQLSYFERGDRNLTWIHLGTLMIVSLMPFSTALLAGYITVRLALIVYWLNILLLGMFYFASWQYAERNGLLREGVVIQAGNATRQRIVVYQLLYALGAALCVFNNYLSIAFITLVQLNAATAFLVQFRRSSA